MEGAVMAMGIGGLGSSKAGINVTPLIDVLLVLLVIFIMVAPVLTRAMPSRLPSLADTPLAPEEAARQVVVHLSEDGGIRVNGVEVAPELLAGRLKEAWMPQPGSDAGQAGRATHPAGVVFLDADAEVAYGAVIGLMDRCRDAGATLIGFVPGDLPASPQPRDELSE